MVTFLGHAGGVTVVPMFSVDCLCWPMMCLSYPVSLLSFSPLCLPPPHVHTTLLASRPQTDSSLRPGKPAKAPAPLPAKAL